MDELANFSSYDFKKTGYDNDKDLEIVMLLEKLKGGVSDVRFYLEGFSANR